jgi:hypothetical protein
MFSLSITQASAVVTLTLFVEDPNEVGTVSIEGNNALALQVRQYLGNTYGAFGHLFDLTRTTAIDLHAALSQSPFVSEVLVGAEMVVEYDPQIPADAVT